MRYVLSVSVLLVLLGAGCVPSSSISNINISQQYQLQPSEVLEASVKAYNISEQKTRCYFKILGDGIEQVEDDQGQSTASLSIRYKVYENHSSVHALDSGMKVLKSIPLARHAFVFDSVDVTSKVGRKLIADLTIKDLNSKRVWRRQISINRSSAFSSEDAMLFEKNGRMMYESLISNLDTFYLKSKVDEPLLVKYYNRDFPISSPPFVAVAPRPFDFTPDGIWEITKQGGKHMLIVDRPGLYLIVQSNADRTGASFVHFSPSYPVPKTVMDLMLPMRYITTKEEFDALNSGQTLKKAVDAHWLEVGGNVARAKKLIRAYYERVEKSNSVFASYMEGWKTDRGMCFIIFGEPTIVKRTSSTEVWVYGQEGQFNALRLTFTKVNNPFTNNDYRLNRMPSLKSSWYRSVEYWRQGRVLTYQK